MVLSFSIFDVLQMIVVLVCVIPCCRVATVDELIVIRVDLCVSYIYTRARRLCIIIITSNNVFETVLTDEVTGKYWQDISQ